MAPRSVDTPVYVIEYGVLGGEAGVGVGHGGGGWGIATRCGCCRFDRGLKPTANMGCPAGTLGDER